MKAFVSAVIAAILIAVVAAAVLRGWMDWSSDNVYRTEQGSVRL